MQEEANSNLKENSGLMSENFSSVNESKIKGGTASRFNKIGSSEEMGNVLFQR